MQEGVSDKNIWGWNFQQLHGEAQSLELRLVNVFIQTKFLDM